MISIDQAREMGARGGTADEHERLLFEAWMAGHCWALCAHWDAHHKQYVSDEETTGYVSMQAMTTRRLWAAWRDRAALENDRARDENNSVAIDQACFDRGCACFDPRIDKNAVIVERRP